MAFIPIETVPAAIGAVAFLIYKLVTNRLQVPQVKRKYAPTAEGQNVEANYANPEPAPEPEELNSAPVRRDVAKRKCFAVFCPGFLLLVCLVSLYLLQKTALDGSESCAREELLEPEPSQDGPSDIDGKRDVDVDKAAVHSDLIRKVDVQESMLPVVADEVKVAEAPLVVPVTRLVLGEGTDSEHVRSAYYGTLMVGSPQQLMTVVFDTGSGQVVLPSAYCDSKTCRSKHRYRKSKSHTGKDINVDGRFAPPGVPRDSMLVNYGTGEIAGVAVEDIVCMKNSKETEALNRTAAMIEKQTTGLDPGCVNMRFVAATSLSEDPFLDFSFDGIVGLGMDALSQNEHFNFLQVIGNHMQGLGSTSPSTFGVFLASSDAEVSEFAFGGWTSGHTLEEVSWSGVHNPEDGHWIIPMRGVRVNGKLLEVCKDGTCKAAVDTGTSLLSVPSEAFAPIFEGIRHQASPAGHCVDKGPLLQLELEQYTIVLGPREYSQVRPALRRPKRKFQQGPAVSSNDPNTRSDLRCFPTLLSMDFEAPLGPKLFILGEPVLRKYYTVYDSQRQTVGMARAAHRHGPNRDELLMRVAELEGLQKGGRSNPTMFDIFRWRLAVRRLDWQL